MNVNTTHFKDRCLDLGAMKYSTMNEWVFISNADADPDFICSRSSGASDYIVEWWRFPTTSISKEKFKLLFVAYHEINENKQGRITFVRDNGTVISEVGTFSDVIWYCSTHLHPDLDTLAYKIDERKNTK